MNCLKCGNTINGYGCGLCGFNLKNSEFYYFGSAVDQGIMTLNQYIQDEDRKIKKATEEAARRQCEAEEATGKRHTMGNAAQRTLEVGENERKQYIPEAEFDLEQIKGRLEALRRTPPLFFYERMCTYNIYKHDRSYEKPFKWFEEEAEKGNADAQYYLGIMYENGRGVYKNYKNAAAWYEKATDQGHAEAAYQLGVLHFYGYLAEPHPIPNHEMAFICFEIAAKQGQVDAQYMVGNMYYYGDGTKKDYNKALEWHEKAAEQGYVMAQDQLGDMYVQKKGTKGDYSKAFQWYRKAAEQGYAKAQYKLGDMYEHGKGTGRDSRIAYEWYLKAADQGDPDAKKKVRRIKTFRQNRHRYNNQ